MFTNHNIIDLTYSSDEDDDNNNNNNKSVSISNSKDENQIVPPSLKQILLDNHHAYSTNNINSYRSNESVIDDNFNVGFCEVDYLKMMEIKSLAVCMNKSDCFKFHETTFDQFQSIPVYGRCIHDCSEKALFYLVDSKPLKIWPEKFKNNQIYQNVHISPYFNEFPLNHSHLKNKRNKLCHILYKSKNRDYTATSIPAYYLCKPSNQSSSNIDGTMRLKQTIECNIRLPISDYKPPPVAPSHIKWCEVDSLEELQNRVTLAKNLGRMLIIVCSKQNKNLWEPKGFELWAHQYPRLMFASIDRDIANAHYDRKLCTKLLGFPYVDGLAFVSHVPGEELCRAFNANNIQTEDIFTSLKLRYEVANQTKVISTLEHNGISSLVEVNQKNALYYCYKQFTIVPLKQEFSFQLEDYEEGLEFDQSVVEVPSSGFTIQRYNKTNDSTNDIDKEVITNKCNSLKDADHKDINMIHSNHYPLGFQLPLLIEQIKSVEWMLERESIDVEVTGMTVHRAHIPIPPIENLSIKWSLQGMFKLAGGILADEMGFGKTACILALITSTKKMTALNKKQKINKNNINNFIQKKTRIKKSKNNELFIDEQKLKVIKLSESEKSSIVPNLENLKSASDHITSSSSSNQLDINNVREERYDISDCPEQLIPTNATLIIVPSHLLYQWENEIKKFTLINYLNYITIANVNDIPTVSEISKADIVLVSIRLFESSVYHERYLGCNLNKLKFINNQIKNNGKNKNINTTNSALPMDELYLNALNKLPLPASSTKLINPLELYYWKRVVIDEIHELVAADDSLSQVIDTMSTKGIPNTTTITNANKSIWTFPIKCLTSKFKWGLTSTPPLFNLEEINSLGSFLGVYIGTCDSLLAKHFVDTFISSNCRQVCTYPKPIEKYVYLQLSIEEMALYAQRRFDLQARLQKHAGVTVAEQNKAYEDILQHCSYFLSNSYTSTTSLSTTTTTTQLPSSKNSYSTTEKEIEKQFESKNKNLNRLQEKLLDVKQQYENCKQSIRLLDQDVTMREDIRRNKLSNLQGRKEELLDKVKSTQNQYNEVQKSIQFFNNSIEQLRTKSKLPECPICLEDMVWGDATITVCGHLQCSHCIQQLFTQPIQPKNSTTTTNNNSINNNSTNNTDHDMQKTGLCATCRRSITMNDWNIIEKESYQQLHLEANNTDDNEDAVDSIPTIPANQSDNDTTNTITSISIIKKPEKKYLAFGTKIAYIVSQIQLILQVDSTAKLLIYCQWDSLKNKLMDAFNKLHVPYVSLEGRPETLRGILDKFQSNGPLNTSLLASTTSHPNIMLCSLELKAAGLNLQVANHIIFVHPFYSCNSKVTTAWEAQAIGRVLRPGQLKQVHIWRFIALDTIEQEILVKRNINQWKMHFS